MEGIEFKREKLNQTEEKLEEIKKELGKEKNKKKDAGVTETSPEIQKTIDRLKYDKCKKFREQKELKNMQFT